MALCESVHFCATLAHSKNNDSGDNHVSPSRAFRRRGRERRRRQETREWLDALSAVIASEGGERAHFLLEQLIDQARQAGIDLPFSANTAYVNTIPTDQEERSPGNIEIEERLRAYMRWNAMAMVVKANRLHPADGGDLGGHISSFASLATMFGTGFNHFWHAETRRPWRRPALHPGPLVARRLCARLHGRPPDRGAAAATSARRSTARASRATRIRS